MRLYSRNQVIGIVVIAVAVTCIGFFAAGEIGKGFPLSKTKAANVATGEAAIAVTGDIQPVSNVPEAQLAVADAPTYTQDETQNITVYQKSNDAVVNITTETVGVNWFLEPVPQEGGSGSGSIIDARGYVVTNTHVIADAVKIYVSLADGSQYEGKVVGTDKENDIAVLKFEPPKDMILKTIPFGESSNLRVGQKVLAIGNPFGLERTLTTGIVSALGRPIKTEAGTIIKDMIQTDTAINPGNSGGPLLDTQGRMIGINTMIYSTSGSSAGIGFAIPVNTAKRVVAELIQYGKVRRGSIDAELYQLTPAIAEYANLKTDKGLLVSRVSSGSNGEKAGLKGGTEAVRYGSGRNSAVLYLGGDIITSIAGQKIETLTDYYSALEAKKPGEIVELTVLRGKQQISMKITLTERSN
jgi:S1-C subfamily serine protease